MTNEDTTMAEREIRDTMRHCNARSLEITCNAVSWRAGAYSSTGWVYGEGLTLNGALGDLRRRWTDGHKWAV